MEGRHPAAAFDTIAAGERVSPHRAYHAEELAEFLQQLGQRHPGASWDLVSKRADPPTR